VLRLRRPHPHSYRIRSFLTAAERWIDVGHHVNVCRHPPREANVAGSEVVKPLGEPPGDQQREPDDHMDDQHPDQPDHAPDQQRDREDESTECRQAAAALDEVGRERNWIHRAPFGCMACTLTVFAMSVWPPCHGAGWSDAAPPMA